MTEFNRAASVTTADHRDLAASCAIGQLITRSAACDISCSASGVYATGQVARCASVSWRLHVEISSRLVVDAPQQHRLAPSPYIRVSKLKFISVCREGEAACSASTSLDSSWQLAHVLATRAQRHCRLPASVVFDKNMHV